MESAWAPANEVEQNMATALAGGDGRRFATVVMSAPLYLPVLPEPGSPQWRQLNAHLPLDQPHVMVFTSLEAMERLLGGFTRGHISTDYPSLARRWPGEGYHLALNPGLPIGAVMPFPALEQLRTGQEELVSAEALADAAPEVVKDRLRAMCLTGLGLAAGVLPVPGPPANDLEATLADAIAAADGERFLTTVLESEVVVPTTVPVDDPLAIHEPGFPWLSIGPAIPVFTSEEMFHSSCGADTVDHSVLVPFMALLANWPDPEHALCLNPGVDSELILTGDTVFNMLIDVSEEMGYTEETPDPLPPAHHDNGPDDAITAMPPVD